MAPSRTAATKFRPHHLAREDVYVRPLPRPKSFPSSSASTARLPASGPPTAQQELLRRLRHPAAPFPRPPSEWANPLLLLDVTRLPPLPEIRDPSARRRAFTHKNFIYQLSLNKTFAEASDDGYRSEVECYRPLEYLGDGVLEQFTRSILVRNYPMLSSGCINFISDKLVSNKTLAYIAWQYGFGSQMRVTPHRRDLNSIELTHQQDIMADVLEAYIGALSLDEDPSRSSPLGVWLEGLVSEAVFPTMREQGELEMRRAMICLRERYIVRREGAPLETRRFRRPQGPAPGEDGCSCREESSTDDRVSWVDWSGQCGGKGIIHTTLFVDGERISCGRSGKGHEARAKATHAGLLLVENGRR